jgi:DNA-binding NarL/FixJ family response regulator
MLRVLIADDHALLRSGLRRILLDELESATVAEAATGEQVLDLVRQQTFELLLLDVGLPGRSGLDVLSEVKELRPKLPVLVLSMHAEEQFAVPALRAGAAGYITKEKAPEELLEAVRKVLSGGRYVSTSLAERLAEDRAMGREGLAHERLSGRELEVLRWIGSGKTVSEIGDGLGLSVKTVSTYRARILEKMGMSSNAELMQYAIRHGLVE